MNFLPAVSVVALLATLPVLMSFERTAGAREFSAACALSAAGIGLVAFAAVIRMPLAAVLGFAALITAFVFISFAFRRFLALSAPPALLMALTLAGGTAGIVTAIGGHDHVGACGVVFAGLGAVGLLVVGLAKLDRKAASVPAVRFTAMGALTIACAGFSHSLGPLSGMPSGGSPGIAFEFALAIMQTIALPSLFLAAVLMLQNRTIGDLSSALARDELTGVLSRGALIKEGERIFSRCLSTDRPAAFLLLDLDYFKQINDHYGHACGDMALAHFAGTVTSFLDGRGAFGRIGGEEFGVVLPDHTEEEAASLAEAICRVVREAPAGRAHQRIRLTVSIGIAAAEPADTIVDVMIRADMALYESKAEGRDRCSVARQRRIDASARALAAAAAQLRQADVPGQEHLRESA
ncbi:diguanylate cyclase (GGDEF)-like protein [Sinorhizobium kostiense]|uniref:diguanylate cyclase n=1 Tax=Sinorhizobium kostiense TaxID=76747 RepID=A0ABS4R4W9_9HYPH|nr:GGDEF domain-containing protein [Sinorhizobium kostiense]MBP2236912.1 diguanylate cyclase (GGDEF)-like protein [Sinorhizobium kostiense]